MTDVRLLPPSDQYSAWDCVDFLKNVSAAIEHLRAMHGVGLGKVIEDLATDLHVEMNRLELDAIERIRIANANELVVRPNSF